MTWLAFAYFFSLGTLSYTGETFDAHDIAMFTASENSFQTTLGVEAQLFDNHVFVGGSVETWESALDLTNFAPSEAFYTFSAGLRAWGFELGFRHECDHPILSRWDGSLSPQWFGVMKDEFYLSFCGALKVF
jgi:hypothetical protein